MTGPGHEQVVPAGDPARWWTLVAVCVATFMLLLDITVVNVALPDIQRDLDATFSDLQWVVDAYALLLAAGLLTAGSLADLLGRRRIFAAGLVVFTAASLLCGLAPSATFLNFARGLQGVGAAAMFATALALLAQTFSGRERGTAFGVWGATTGGAVAVGPLVGGVLTEGLSWHWIFFVNLPIGAAALAVTFLRVAESRDPEATGIDWAGLVTWTGALFLLVFGLIRGNAEGWGSPLIVSMLVGSAVLLVAFLVVERAQERPMFDLTLFRKPSFVGASVAAFALSASAFAMFLYLTLYIQNILGYSPLQTGLRFLPITFLSFLVAPIAGKLSSMVPVRALMGGGLALIGVAFLLNRGLTASSGWMALLPGFIVLGIGIGLTNPPLASTAVSVVEPARSGMASGINSTFRQVGIATGIAALGAVFQSSIEAKALSTLSGTPAGGGGRTEAIVGGLSSGQIGRSIAEAPPQFRGDLARAADTAFVAAMNELFLIAAIVALAGAVAVFVLVRSKDLVGQQAPAREATDAAPEPAGARVG